MEIIETLFPNPKVYNSLIPLPLQSNICEETITQIIEQYKKGYELEFIISTVLGDPYKHFKTEEFIGIFLELTKGKLEPKLTFKKYIVSVNKNGLRMRWDSEKAIIEQKDLLISLSSKNPTETINLHGFLTKLKLSKEKIKRNVKIPNVSYRVRKALCSIPYDQNWRLDISFTEPITSDITKKELNVREQIDIAPLFQNFIPDQVSIDEFISLASKFNGSIELEYIGPSKKEDMISAINDISSELIYLNYTV